MPWNFFLQTMYYNRTYFEKLFEVIRQKILELTDNRLDILNKDDRPASAALGNNLGEKEVLQQIESSRKKEKTDRLGYEAGFKAVHYINLHPDVEALANAHNRRFFDFGRRLYLKMKQLKDQQQSDGVEIKDALEMNALLLFVDCENESVFCSKYNVTNQPERTAERKKISNPQKKNSQKPSKFTKEPGTEPFVFQIEEGFHHFLFCYYSKRSDRIKKAIVAISNDETEGYWEARQYGFHQASGGDFASIAFRGKAKIFGRRLYINLESDPELTYQPMQMNFIGLLEETVARRINLKPIPCALQTVSIHAQYTISTEGYLLPCSIEQIRAIVDNPKKLMEDGIPLETENNAYTVDQLENLSLYLTMSRKHFHLELNKDGEPMTNLDELAIRMVPVANFTNRLEGVWRLWNFGLQRAALIESKLIIEKDFRTRFEPYIEAEVKKGIDKGMLDQLATLSISDEIRREQLCVTTYSPKGDLMNMTTFDFDGLRGGLIAEGIFLSVGYDRPNNNNNYKTAGPIGGYVVMRKQQPGDPDFKPGKIKPDEVEQYVKDLGLEEMLQRLKVLWKRKTQKKPVNLRMGAFAVCSSPDKGLLVIEKQEEPYRGRYHLPGGMLKEQGKALDEILSAAFLRQTGFDPGPLALWQNVTDILTIKHSRNVNEKIHLVGALYKSECTHVPSQTGASYIDPRGMEKEKFTPFAWVAAQDFLKNNP